MRKLLYIVMICLLGLGCRKSERDNDTLTDTAEENAMAEAIYGDVFKMIHRAALNASGISRSPDTDSTLFGCDQVVVDTTASPKTLFIDFRFTGCIGGFDVPRKGRIIAEFTGLYPDSNSIINILFLNYSFGDYQVNGNIIIVNRGTNDKGRKHLTFFLQDGTISNERNGTINWQGNKSWELIAGESTPSFADDVYYVTGTSFGTNRNGNGFDTEVEKLNKMTYNCLHFSEGITKINVKNLNPRTIDYGSGTCDRTAAVTINGEEHQVTLPQ